MTQFFSLNSGGGFEGHVRVQFRHVRVNDTTDRRTSTFPWLEINVCVCPTRCFDLLRGAETSDHVVVTVIAILLNNGAVSSHRYCHTCDSLVGVAWIVHCDFLVGKVKYSIVTCPEIDT